MRTLSIFTSLALLLGAAPAAGQPATDPPAVNFDRLMGRELRIMDTRGVERFGTLCAVGSGELRLVGAAGEFGVPLSGITRLDRRGDSVKEGLVLGMLWPLAAFALGGGQGASSERSAWIGLVAAIPIGAVFGAGIDALNRGWTNEYRAHRRSAVRILPAARGVRVAYVRRF
jgi:hypothetical protein